MNLRHIRSALGLPMPKPCMKMKESSSQLEVKEDLPHPGMQLQYPQPEVVLEVSTELASSQPPAEAVQGSDQDPDEQSSHVREEDVMDVDSAEELVCQDIIMEEFTPETESEAPEDLHSSLFTPEPVSESARDAGPPSASLPPRNPTPPPTPPSIYIEAPARQKKPPQAPTSSTLFIPKKKLHAPKPMRTSSQLGRLHAGRNRSRSPMPGGAKIKNWAMTTRREYVASNQPRLPPPCEASRRKGPGRPRRLSNESYTIHTDSVAKHPEPTKVVPHCLLTKVADNLHAGLVDLDKAMCLADGEEYQRRCAEAVKRASSSFEDFHRGMHSIKLDFLKRKPELLRVIQHVAERNQMGKAMTEEVYEFRKRVKEMNSVFSKRLSQQIPAH